MIFLPLLGFANPNENKDYWICKSHDNSNREWTIKNNYQKIAINQSFDACKKESKNPRTCKTSDNDCEGYHLGFSTKPYWRCMALDKTANHWKSNYYSNKDDAFLAAKAYCRSESRAPDSCYVNMITCANVNESQD
jgi:hypothetical protein